MKVAPPWAGEGHSLRYDARDHGDVKPLSMNPVVLDVAPTDLVCFYDARRLNLSDGDPVATWQDASGNGNDVTQGTGANQPTYRGPGSASAINGVPTVEFDGSNDVLTSTSFGSEWSGTENALTWVAVIELPGSTGGGFLWGPGNGSDDSPLLVARDGSSTWDLQYRGDTGGGAVLGGAPHEGGPDVVSWRFVEDSDGTVAFFQSRTHRLTEGKNDLDNPLEGQKTFNQFGLGALFRTSTSNHTAFTLGMLACYSRRLAFDDLLLVEQWMGEVYGLTVG